MDDVSNLRLSMGTHNGEHTVMHTTSAAQQRALRSEIGVVRVSIDCTAKIALPISLLRRLLDDLEQRAHAFEEVN